jgi:hypothetical protein
VPLWYRTCRVPVGDGHSSHSRGTGPHASKQKRAIFYRSGVSLHDEQCQDTVLCFNLQLRAMGILRNACLWQAVAFFFQVYMLRYGC